MFEAIDKIVDKPILSLKGVGKSFPGTRALDDINLDFYEGEIHVLLGENGAGKSTLIKILSGIYFKDEGDITYLGEPMNLKGALDAQNLGISVVHQELNLCRDITVADNIFIGREFEKNGFLDKTTQNKKAKELLDKMGLDMDPTKLISELTVGEQQLVEIAKALSFESKVLILDEPTSAITGKEVDTLFSIMKQLKKNGVALIYISHRMEEFEIIADKVSVLRDGQYIGTKAFKDTTLDELIQMMVGREVYSDYPARVNNVSNKVVMAVKSLSCDSFFQDVSFELKEGEILGISGLMGAGRTEIAKTIIGFYHKSNGEIKIFDKVVLHPTIEEVTKLGVAYLTEDRRHEGLALNQDIVFNSILASVKEFSNKFGFLKLKENEKATKDYIKLLKIKAPSSHTLISALSGGNQQKVIIGRWLIKNSKILIMDEPTRGIDVNAKQEIYQLIRELSRKGISVLMISSELPELMGMSDRIAVMSRGHLTKILDKKDFSQELIMKYATDTVPA